MAVKTEYRLVFASNIEVKEANNLRSRIAQILEQADFGALTILFSSDGGSTDQSLALFNFIDQLPVPVRMHAIGHVGSASVPVFLAATRRTCSPFARFFFHEYDWGFSARQTLNRIDEAVKRLRSDIELARQIIKSRTQATSEILETLDGRASPIIAGPNEARALGFIQDICEIASENGMKVATWTASVA